MRKLLGVLKKAFGAISGSIYKRDIAEEDITELTANDPRLATILKSMDLP